MITSYAARTGMPLATVPVDDSHAVDAVVTRARTVALQLARTEPRRRRDWLSAIADTIEAQRVSLLALAEIETGIGSERLGGEITRAATQLRFYGDVATEGSFLGVTIDHATEQRPQLVRVNQPLGPVAMFGASNLPFAFGVLGNDTGLRWPPGVRWW